jgi:hypothetical protein
MTYNRKQRRSLERKSRHHLKGADITKVATLLSQVEGYKQEIQILADKVAGEGQGRKFARLLCKLTPLIDLEGLEEGDVELLADAKRLLE